MLINYVGGKKIFKVIGIEIKVNVIVNFRLLRE